MIDTCPDSSDWSRLREGLLPIDHRARLEVHLTLCARCREAYTAAPFSAALAELQGLAQTVPGTGDTAVRPALTPEAPRQLGHFELVRLLGQGGMGQVYEAVDTRLGRRVALKLLDAARAGDATARERFAREARAVARVSHEHVVAVYHVEPDGPAPFLVMQLVAGESLEARLEGGWRPSPAEAARLGRQIASGLAAAHAEGVIHRDIKPANILLEAGTERVKLTDFGLARMADDVKLTRPGLVAGTPLYMSPEQAHGGPVDHRGDLFSLGVVLYELCTGEVPWSAPTPLAVMKKLTEEAHRPVASLNAGVPVWLGAIIDRLLEKAPEQRFQSAAEVERALATHAPPSSPLLPLPTRAGGGASRRWLWGVAAVAVLAGLVGLLFPLFRRGNGPQAGPTPLRSLDVGTGPIWSAAFAGEGTTVALALNNGSVRFWDADTGRAVATLDGAHKGAISAVAVSRDGRHFATGGDDRMAKVWDGATRRPVAILEHKGAVLSLAFSPTGDRLGTGTLDGALQVWSVSDRKPVLRLRGHDGAIHAVAYSPDGQTIASAGGDRTVTLWDARTGARRVPLSGHEGAVYSLAFHPEGRLLATGGWDRTLRWWDVDTGEARGAARAHEQDVLAVAISPDARLLASGGEDNTVRIRYVTGGWEAAVLRAHARTVTALAFSRDGRLLVTAGREGQALVWDAQALGR